VKYDVGRFGERLGVVRLDILANIIIIKHSHMLLCKYPTITATTASIAEFEGPRLGLEFCVPVALLVVAPVPVAELPLVPAVTTAPKLNAVTVASPPNSLHVKTAPLAGLVTSPGKLLTPCVPGVGRLVGLYNAPVERGGRKPKLGQRLSGEVRGLGEVRHEDQIEEAFVYAVMPRRVGSVAGHMS
jgi:hypothetical protein